MERGGVFDCVRWIERNKGRAKGGKHHTDSYGTCACRIRPSQPPPDPAWRRCPWPAPSCGSGATRPRLRQPRRPPPRRCPRPAGDDNSQEEREDEYTIRLATRSDRRAVGRRSRAVRKHIAPTHTLHTHCTHIKHTHTAHTHTHIQTCTHLRAPRGGGDRRREARVDHPRGQDDLVHVPGPQARGPAGSPPLARGDGFTRHRLRAE